MKFQSNCIRKFFPFLIAFSFYLSGGRILFAHDAWIEVLGIPDHPIIYGDKVPEPYRSEKIKSVKGFDINHRPIKTQIDRKSVPARVKVSEDAALLTLILDNGFWQRIGDDYKELGKSEKSPKADTMQTIKIGKTILKWPKWVYEPLGLRMEIVPEKIGPEDQATFRVLYEGKPVADAVLENQAHPMPGKTDIEGRITVKIKPGLQRFSVEYIDSTLSNARIGSTSVTAVLVFQLDASPISPTNK